MEWFYVFLLGKRLGYELYNLCSGVPSGKAVKTSGHFHPGV